MSVFKQVFAPATVFSVYGAGGHDHEQMYPINYGAKTCETAAFENESRYTPCVANREGVHIYNAEFADRWESCVQTDSGSRDSPQPRR